MERLINNKEYDGRREAVVDIAEVEKILNSYKDGEINLQDAMEMLKYLPFKDIGYAKIDNHRSLRNAYPEVIFCEGKTVEQITGIIEAMLPGKGNIIATRLSREKYELIKDLWVGEYSEQAKLLMIKQKEIVKSKGVILIVTAGTSDIGVAEEAAITAEALGNTVQRLYDVGVAGIHRLLAYYEQLNAANVIIAVAGMEGALTSIIAGLVDKPVIGVPTSIGYGASFHGLSALLTMLNSCASGVGVVNIDNGFGAAYLASTINRQIELASQTKRK